MIRSGIQLINDYDYLPSRPPGYLVPELVIGIASLIGGHWLANAVSALLAVTSLFLFYHLLKVIIPESSLTMLVLCVAFNPFYVLAATTSMDYIYSIFFILLTIHLLISRNVLSAGLMAAMALSCRPGNGLIIVSIYLCFLLKAQSAGDKFLMKLFYSGVLAFLMTLLLFFPSFKSADYSMSFISYAGVKWSWFGHFSRFFYKNLSLIGILQGIWLLVCIFRNKNHIQKDRINNYLIPGALFIVTLHSLLFLKVPLEIAYQLPLLFIILPLISWYFNFCPRQLAVLLMLNLFSSFVCNVELIEKKYNSDKTEVISATPGIFLNPGIVVDDLLRRNESEQFYCKKYGFSLRQ